MSASDPFADISKLPDNALMAHQFARSKMDRTSGIIMLVGTGLALLAAYTIGPPSTDATISGVLLLLALVTLDSGVWALRLWRVGKIASDNADLIAPLFSRQYGSF